MTVYVKFVVGFSVNKKLVLIGLVGLTINNGNLKKLDLNSKI